MPTTLLLPLDLQTFLRPCSHDIVLCWSYKLRPVNPVQSVKIFLKEHFYVCLSNEWNTLLYSFNKMKPKTKPKNNFLLLLTYQLCYTLQKGGQENFFPF